MSVNAVSGKKGAVPASQTSGLREENGKMVVNFQGKKYTLTQKQAEAYSEALYNVNYVRNKVDSLKTKLAAGDLSVEDKKKYSEELTKLQEKYVKQQQFANFEISPTGDAITFNIKKDVPAETFKELFSIEDGALRNDLKKEALMDGIGVQKYADIDDPANSQPFSSYDQAKLNGIERFSNGVYLEDIDDAGHYQPVYSKATLQAGGSYTIPSSSVDPYKDAPFYTRWFGIGKD